MTAKEPVRGVLVRPSALSGRIWAITRYTVAPDGSIRATEKSDITGEFMRAKAQIEAEGWDYEYVAEQRHDR